MNISILSYNTLFAGRDGADDRRFALQIDLINALRPDVFLMQEAKGLDANGYARLHEWEGRIAMRGFLGTAPRTGQNVAVFIRAPLRALAFEVDNTHFHHATAMLKVEVPGRAQPFTFVSTHLCPCGAHVRRLEAAYLAGLAAPDALTLIGGDFNSASPRDPEPEDWGALAPHHRARYLAEDLAGVDRSVIAHLEAAGWVDLGHRLCGGHVPTVPTAGYRGAEFATMRCDYLFASKALAERARRYEVLRTPDTGQASDHYPVLLQLDASV
ncbi:endonuclease/exonuclease/phosphatase family protein [Burkholderia stagnalis]